MIIQVMHSVVHQSDEKHISLISSINGTTLCLSGHITRGHTLFNDSQYVLLCSSSAHDIESLVAGMEPSVNKTAITILMLQRNISKVQQLITDLDASMQSVSVLVQI